MYNTNNQRAKEQTAKEPKAKSQQTQNGNEGA